MPFNSTYTDNTPPIWVAVVLSLILLGNVAGLFWVGVHTDEAYYWVWSQRLDYGYYDHPPMIAWMIRLFSEIFGNKAWAIRLPSVLAWIVSAYVVYNLGRDLFRSSTAGWLAILVLSSLPIFQVGFHVVGPDSPLLLFSALTYYFVYRATAESSWQAWLLAGVMVGFGMLGKYTAVLIPAIVFLYLLVVPTGRRQLASPWPWVAGIFALTLFLPVVLWNYQHDWASFLYQWGHGTSTNKGFSFDNILEYLGQQLSAAAPWVFVAMVYAGLKVKRVLPKDSGDLVVLLIIGFWFPLVFFGVTGSVSRSMHNWPVIAYIPGSVLLAGLLNRWLYPDGYNAGRQNRQRVWAKYTVVSATIFSLLLVNLARFPYWAYMFEQPVLPKGTSLVAVWGWDKLGNVTKKIIAESQWDRRCRILAVPDYNNAGLGYYHAAGELAFQLGDADMVTVSPVPHFKQYNIWLKERRDSAYRNCAVLIGPTINITLPQQLRSLANNNWTLKQRVIIDAPDRTQQTYGVYLPAEEVDSTTDRKK